MFHQQIKRNKKKNDAAQTNLQMLQMRATHKFNRMFIFYGFYLSNTHTITHWSWMEEAASVLPPHQLVSVVSEALSMERIFNEWTIFLF